MRRVTSPSAAYRAPSLLKQPKLAAATSKGSLATRNPHEVAAAGCIAMNPDQERWAEAMAIEQRHGDAAPVFVAERLGALALEGDWAGVTRWQAIAQRLDSLRSGQRGEA